MDLIRTYTPEDVVLIMQYENPENGLRYIEYVKNWNRISVKRSSDVFRTIKGIRGSMARHRTLDKSWTMTLTIDQTSKTNYHLFQLLKLDANDVAKKMLTFYLFDDNAGKIDKETSTYFQGVTGYLPTSNSGTCVESSSCFIQGMPDVTFEGDTTEMEWTIVSLGSTTYNIGYSGTSLREDLLNNPSGVLSSVVGAASNALKTVGSGLSNITKLF